jgi:non-haem Fe2+, alpha-ketoglutarate-dependent halogenase
MPKSLSSSALEAYRRDGYYFPVPVLLPREVEHCRRCLEEHEATTGQPLQGNFRHKAHLLFIWVDELVHHPKIVDAAEDVLGPNLLCWATSFFIKEANSPGFVSWHQDAFYWGLSKDDVMTAWVALSPANLQSGCMKFVPGSQTQDQIQHVDTFHKDNLLSRGQEITVKVDNEQTVDCIS